MRPMRLVPGLLMASLFVGVTPAQDSAPAKNRKVRSGPAAPPTTEQLRAILKDAAAAVKTVDRRARARQGPLELPDFESRLLEEPKADALRAIGAAQAKIGDKESARKTWGEALDAANALRSFNPSDKAALITRIAAAQADAGVNDDALESLRQATEASRPSKGGQNQGQFGALRLPLAMDGDPAAGRAAVLVGIADVQAKAGDQRAATQSFDQATEAANTIKNPANKFRALVDIARAQDPTGDRDVWDRTLAGALALGDDFQKAKATEFVLRALVQMGKEEPALRLTNDRFQGDLKALSLAVITSELIGREKPASLHFAQSLREAATNVKLDRPFKRSTLFAQVAALLARAGDTDGAFKMIDSLDPDSADAKTRHPRERVDVLKEVAQFQLKAGRKNEAKETLRTALEMIAPLRGDHGEAPPALKDLVELLAKADDTEQAVSLTARIQDNRGRAESLLEIASVQADSGTRAGAVKTIDRALEFADGIPNDLLWMSVSPDMRSIVRNVNASSPAFDFSFQMEPKYDILRSAAVALARVGDFPRAIETAKRIPNDEDFAGRRQSVEAFTRIASIQAEDGDFDGALKTADLISEDESLFQAEKATLLGAIAREQARQGDPRKVLERAARYTAPKTRLLVWQRMAEGIAETPTREKKPAPAEKP